MSILKLGFIIGVIVACQPAFAQMPPSYEDASEFFQPFDESFSTESFTDETIDPLLKNKGVWSYQFTYVPRDGIARDLARYRIKDPIKPASILKLFTGWMAYKTEAQPLDYLSDMLHRSDNLLAQQTLIKMGGVSKMEAFYREMNLPITASTFHAVDGSGLSHSNLLTSDLVVTLLTQIHISGQYDPFKRLLAQPHEDGTLQGRFGDLAYPLYGKTGTLRDTAALAGFVELNHGTLIFSIISNSLKIPVPSARGLIDQVVHNYIKAAEAI